MTRLVHSQASSERLRAESRLSSFAALIQQHQDGTEKGAGSGGEGEEEQTNSRNVEARTECVEKEEKEEESVRASVESSYVQNDVEENIEGQKASESTESSEEDEEESASRPSLWSRLSQRADAEDKQPSSSSNPPLFVGHPNTTTTNTTTTSMPSTATTEATISVVPLVTTADADQRDSKSSNSINPTSQPSVFDCFLPAADRRSARSAAVNGTSKAAAAKSGKPRRSRAPLQTRTNLVLD
jgi:hypothetical protein